MCRYDIEDDLPSDNNKILSGGDGTNCDGSSDGKSGDSAYDPNPRDAVSHKSKQESVGSMTDTVGRVPQYTTTSFTNLVRKQRLCAH